MKYIWVYFLFILPASSVRGMTRYFVQNNPEYHLGIDAYNQEKYELAEEFLQNSIHTLSDQERIKAHHKLAIIAKHHNDNNKANQHINCALKLIIDEKSNRNLIMKLNALLDERIESELVKQNLADIKKNSLSKTDQQQFFEIELTKLIFNTSKNKNISACIAYGKYIKQNPLSTNNPITYLYRGRSHHICANVFLYIRNFKQLMIHKYLSNYHWIKGFYIKPTTPLYAKARNHCYQLVMHYDFKRSFFNLLNTYRLNRIITQEELSNCRITSDFLLSNSYIKNDSIAEYSFLGKIHFLLVYLFNSDIDRERKKEHCKYAYRYLKKIIDETTNYVQKQKSAKNISLLLLNFSHFIKEIPTDKTQQIINHYLSLGYPDVQSDKPFDPIHPYITLSHKKNVEKLKSFCNQDFAIFDKVDF